ncbi:MAG TPA: PDZ domain-containing protein [Anaerolineae bacterium]|nr:PDZ domain-containing protein [Anaerolineae bacterium]
MRKLGKVFVILIVLALLFLGGRLAAQARAVGPEGALRLAGWPQEEEEEGLVILSVVEGSPAEEAGIKRGDILLALDGKAVKSLRALRKMVFCHEPGDEVSLLIRHGDEEGVVKVTLGEKELWPGEKEAYLGLQFCPCLPYEVVGYTFEIPEVTIEPAVPLGAMVLEVEKGGPAEEAGLKRGDVILAVDGQEVDEKHPLPWLIKSREPGDEVELKVWREGEELAIRLKLGEREGKAYLGVFFAPLPYGPFLWGWERMGPKMRYYFAPIAPGEEFFLPWSPEMLWFHKAPKGKGGPPSPPLLRRGLEGSVI